MEYLDSNHPENNPFLTKKSIVPTPSVKKYTRKGLSIAGLVLLFITGIITLFSAPAIGLILFLLGFLGLIIVAADKQEKDIFKFFYYLGKFIGILTALFGILLFAIIIIGLIILIIFSI